MVNKDILKQQQEPMSDDEESYQPVNLVKSPDIEPFTHPFSPSPTQQRETGHG